jgi:hypothetical protein
MGQICRDRWIGIVGYPTERRLSIQGIISYHTATFVFASMTVAVYASVIFVFGLTEAYRHKLQKKYILFPLIRTKPICDVVIFSSPKSLQITFLLALVQK